MCLSGNEATMIETLQALNDTRLALKQWLDAANEGPRTIEVSYAEGFDILNARIANLEAKCRELGCHGPAPKADPGDQHRILAQR